MELTPNRGLKKPAPEEFINIQDLNDNMDVLDVHMHTPEEVGLSNVLNKSVDDQTPTITEAASLMNLTAGDTAKILWGKVKKAISSLIAHLGNTANPHETTAAQVGAAPVSHTHTPAQVGLGNVNNTSDAAKPISTATQAALNTKIPQADIINNLTSTATDKPPSAAMVKKLNEEKAPVSHTHTPAQVGALLVPKDGGYFLQNGSIENGTLGNKAVNLCYTSAGLIGARGAYSHAVGNNVTASGEGSHAEGKWTTADGKCSHVEGESSSAFGDYSHVGGYNVVSAIFASHTIGTYNKSSTENNRNSYSATADAFTIGNGTSGNPGNAFRVTFNGKTYGLSAFNSTGADYAEYFEWLDGNPDNADRAGYFVTLDGDKIRKAIAQDDYILGVVSVNPSVIGDSYQDDWYGKYLRDEWGRIQYHYIDVPARLDDEGKEIEPARQDYVPVLNPEWDVTEDYIPREKRHEWAAVGLMGKLLVRDDGTCQVNGYCHPDDNGIATSAADGCRVMRRMADNIVQILIKGA
jgi:hypothetical protein